MFNILISKPKIREEKEMSKMKYEVSDTQTHSNVSNVILVRQHAYIVHGVYVL